eukprot:TRINITY_DN6008_c0_g1_i1.p2 TRINITY_DN6008_c0_g1~~TRINITY_DN6008_c0_g1_i1.p2  ORF type:complete len:111 (+),score=28.03 TRINITY_DN6008_c0_g1_i1:37-369(+)
MNTDNDDETEATNTKRKARRKQKKRKPNTKRKVLDSQSSSEEAATQKQDDSNGKEVVSYSDLENGDEDELKRTEAFVERSSEDTIQSIDLEIELQGDHLLRQRQRTQRVY